MILLYMKTNYYLSMSYKWENILYNNYFLVYVIVTFSRFTYSFYSLLLPFNFLIILNFSLNNHNRISRDIIVV